MSLKETVISALIGLSKTVRFILGDYGCCRHIPTCITYFEDQLSTKPLHIAFYNSGLRILSCHPFSQNIPRFVLTLALQRTQNNLKKPLHQKAKRQ